jgi:hypothetical protein
MAKSKDQTFIKGQGSHRRTESDYMGVLLDSISLDDWREVVERLRTSHGDSGPVTGIKDVWWAC